MSIAAIDIHVQLSGRRVLTGASIRVETGTVVGLLGPNGAGKSTLIRALSGHLAATGQVLVNEMPVESFSRARRARLIAYLPQQRVIGWPVKVKDIVDLGRMPWRTWGVGPSENDRVICRQAMELMDVVHLADRPADALSGGEQARVLTARAIAQDTPVLLADEPASGLDPAHQIAMMAGFRKIAASGRAVLVSLHDLTLAARWCDRLAILHDGRTVGGGVPAEVMVPEVLGGVFGIAARVETDSCGLIVSPVGLARDAGP